ncbi:MAG TPA: hypothetical protein VH062_12845 [Polyangiaceae bacterium]|jgi:hypothetical protein|nr:hypothetical protein [Polyangiaceae bacterium]
MSAGSMPPPGTLTGTLARAAVISRFVAALLVAVVSLRFAAASFQHALGSTAASQTVPGVAPSHAAPSSSGLVRPRAGSSTEGPPVAGRPRSIQLGISEGPGRSDIYVNGRLLGQTPFVGDTSCKTGLPLRIELVPTSGPPLVYERACRGTMIEISGPPP